MGKLTIKQIAAQAGVSIGTVDRVLHQRGRVSKEKENLILEICRRDGYEQNVVGKAMAMQKSPRTVAVIINAKERNSFAAQVYEGLKTIEEEISDYSIKFIYHDLLVNTIEEQLEILRALEHVALAGLIIKPIESPMIQFCINKFSAKGIPVVFCTSDIAAADKLCFVGQNHYRDGRLMANAATKFSHEPLRVLMIVGPLQTSARKARIDGFLSYMKSHEKAFEICNVCEVSYHRDEAFQKALEALQKYPEANALYINSPEIEPCIEALQAYEKFEGLRFCFGHQQKVGPLVAGGKLDFAIAELPFQHGYRSGEVMFKYLLNKEVPIQDRCIFNGQILLEENSIDLSCK